MFRQGRIGGLALLQELLSGDHDKSVAHGTSTLAWQKRAVASVPKAENQQNSDPAQALSIWDDGSAARVGDEWHVTGSRSTKHMSSKLHDDTPNAYVLDLQRP